MESLGERNAIKSCGFGDSELTLPAHLSRVLPILDSSWLADDPVATEARAGKLEDPN
jgi:hypothetical protein